MTDQQFFDALGLTVRLPTQHYSASIDDEVI